MSAELTTTSDTPMPADTAPDLRAGLMHLPAAQMQEVLIEFTKRRETFRAWLQSQLIEGVHYGYPPDCKPKTDAAGNILQWKSKANREVVVPKDQWQGKPSLYKAGAELVIDLMAVRAEFEADTMSAEQLGLDGAFVMVCRLRSRAGELIGEGRGVFTHGEKKMSPNSAIKMCQKRAKVDAVLNSWGLSDLFTQDLEDPDWVKPPVRKGGAPPARPREERDNLSRLQRSWMDRFNRDINEPDENRVAFGEWLDATIGTRPDVGEWTEQQFRDCFESLSVPF